MNLPKCSSGYNCKMIRCVNGYIQNKYQNHCERLHCGETKEMLYRRCPQVMNKMREYEIFEKMKLLEITDRKKKNTQMLPPNSMSY